MADLEYFELDMVCPLENRINYIYSQVFPGIKKYQLYQRVFIAKIAQAIDYSPLKVWLYKSIGIRIGKRVFISPGVVIDPHFPSLIEIRDYVILGYGSKLSTHEFSGTKYRAGKIVIDKGAVLGGLSIIRGAAKKGGIIVGECANVATGTTVYKDVPAYATILTKETLIIESRQGNVNKKL